MRPPLPFAALEHLDKLGFDELVKLVDLDFSLSSLLLNCIELGNDLRLFISASSRDSYRFERLRCDTRNRCALSLSNKHRCFVFQGKRNVLFVPNLLIDTDN